MRIHKLFVLALVLTGGLLPGCRGVEAEKDLVPVSFRVQVQDLTKGAEWTGTTLPVDARLYAVASRKTERGQVDVPSLYMSGAAYTYGRLAHATGETWQLQDATLPLGGYMLDVLAFGAANASWEPASTWTPTLAPSSQPAADYLAFENVDTYASQMDLMYGSVNNYMPGQPGTPALTLSHAQALLVFNIKFDDSAASDAAIGFITDNIDGEGCHFRLKDIAFMDKENHAHYPASIVLADVLLKTRGTFTIDNSKVLLEAGWSDLSASATAYTVPMESPVRTATNAAAHASLVFSNTVASWKRDDIVRGTAYQVGNALLVPEQEVQPFVVFYEYDGTPYHLDVNPPHGVWKAGHQYVYTLVFTKVIP